MNQHAPSVTLMRIFPDSRQTRKTRQPPRYLRTTSDSRPLLALIMALLMHSVPAWSETLVEAIGLARQHDPAYQAALGEYAAAMAAINLGKASLRPQISFSASQGKSTIEREFLGRQATPTSEEKLSTSNRVLQMRQALINLEGSARADIGYKRAEIADTNLAVQLAALINRTSKAYLAAVAAQDELNLAVAALSLAQTQLSLVTAQVTAGEATRVEVADARARLDIATAQREQASDALDLALRILSSLAGKPVTQVNSLNDRTVSAKIDEAQFDAWQEGLLRSNPEVIAARKNIELEELELARRQVADKPRLDLILLKGQFQSDTINITNQRIDQSAASLQLQVPLYAGGAYRAEVEEQEGIVNKTRGNANETARRQTLELRRAWSVLANSRSRLQALERAVQASELLLQSAQAGLANKVKVMADVLEARRQLTQSQRDLGRARIEVIDAQLQALILSGEITEDNLVEIQRYFQP